MVTLKNIHHHTTKKNVDDYYLFHTSGKVVGNNSEKYLSYLYLIVDYIERVRYKDGIYDKDAFD